MGAVVREQRRARLWGIFFKLLTFAYISLILLMAIDWKDSDIAGGKKYTVRAIPGTGTIGSVVFKVDGKIVRTESFAPHSIGGVSMYVGAALAVVIGPWLARSLGY